MSFRTLISVPTSAPHVADRKREDAPFNSYDYRSFRLGLMDVLCAWVISGVIIAIAFVLAFALALASSG